MIPSGPLLNSWASKCLQIFFRLLYHQVAWAYDAVAWCVSLGMWKRWVLSVLPSVRGPNVLEIGHGPGHLLLALKRAGYHVVGLDESMEMGRLVVKRLSYFGLDRLCVNGYAQFIPFPSDYFNTVCSTFPSEYIFDRDTLTEVLRVLVPGGRLVLLPTAWLDRSFIPGRLISWFLELTGYTTINNDDVYAKPLTDSGFFVQTQINQLAHSRSLIILATKPSIKPTAG